MSHYDYEEVTVDSSGFEGLQLKIHSMRLLAGEVVGRVCLSNGHWPLGSSEAADPCPKAPKYPEYIQCQVAGRYAQRDTFGNSD